jgi:hypothetical protein
LELPSKTLVTVLELELEKTATTKFPFVGADGRDTAMLLPVPALLFT